MYIWRRKNRRDRRDLLTSGKAVWGPPKGEFLRTLEDEKLRHEGEAAHVNYFVTKVREVIFNYLNTKDGKAEIDLMVAELDKPERLLALEMEEAEEAEGHEHGGTEVDPATGLKPATKDEKKPNPKDAANKTKAKDNKATVPPEMMKKKNIYEIFRKFDADGSNSIDKEELTTLLKELNVPMTEKEIDKLMNDLDDSGDGGIDFEEFYAWFVKEAHNQRKKNRFAYLTSAAGDGVFKGLKRLVLEVEARNLIFDVTVLRAELGARKEYRIAHPPPHLCPICDKAFLEAKDLLPHARDDEFHEEFLKKRAEDNVKMRHVDAVFVGPVGRRLAANRLLFSSHLLPMEERIKAAVPSPFRPMKTDPGQKRVTQLLRGMFVTGADARAGIRPFPSVFGLKRQHKAPGLTSLQQPLLDVLAEVHCIRDEKVDIVMAAAAAVHTDVRFQWNGEVQGSIQLTGEFNAWKPEPLDVDHILGKCYIIKKLCPGRYRYKYVLDGKELVDPTASVVEDECGRNNVIVVINPKTKGDCTIKGLKHINLRNNILCDDGTWALANFIHANSLIESVDLSYNQISDEGVLAISSFLPRLFSLTTLSVNGNGFGFDGTRYLLKALNDSKTITHLELSGNRIGDDGTEIISNLIKHHCSLKHLYLDSNLVGNDGAICLGAALVNNRTLLSLSLSHNKIFEFGAERLCTSLRSNGTLTDLRIASNPLGPHGTVWFGGLIDYNNVITVLDLSDVSITRGRLSNGVHALCYGLTRNRSLKALYLRYNSMEEDRIVDLAHALTSNKTLLELDITGNQFDGRWLYPNTVLETKVLKAMPSIRSSLDKNREISQDPHLSYKFSVKAKDKVVFDDNDTEFEGEWDHRRRWKKVDRVKEAKKAALLASNEELARKKLEDDYIHEHLSKHMTSLGCFLEGSAGRRYVNQVAKLISKHLAELANIREPEEPEVDHEQELRKMLAERRGITITGEGEGKNGEGGGGNVEGKSKDPNNPESNQGDDAANGQTEAATAKDKDKKKKRGRLLAAEFVPESEEEKLKKKQDAEDEAFIAEALAAIPAKKPKPPPLVQIDDRFMFSHNSIMAAVFMELGATERHMYIPPESLEQAFQALALPLRRVDVQPACDATLNVKALKIGFRKFAKYVLDNSTRLARENNFQRLRIMLDLYFRPPFEEAERLILSHEIFYKKNVLIKEFRSMPGRKPKFVCAYCLTAFTTEKALLKHKAKNGGSEHVRLDLNTDIYNDQKKFLRHTKWLLTGSFFPCYYELVSEDDLPPKFYPQIFDNMGGEGRPMGVLEHDMTIRVEDCLGDFMQVRYENQRGWARYRVGKSVVLRKACMDVPGFTWDGLQTLDEPAYYQVVPVTRLKRMELKVRMKPLLTAEAIGHLQADQIIEVGAIFGDWLQIRYKNVQAAWIVAVAGGGSVGVSLIKEHRERLELKRLEEEEEERKYQEWVKEQMEMFGGVSKKGKKIFRAKKNVDEEDEKEPSLTELVKPLPFIVQKRLASLVTKSPFIPRPGDTDYDEEEERLYIQRMKEREERLKAGEDLQDDMDVEGEKDDEEDND